MAVPARYQRRKSGRKPGVGLRKNIKKMKGLDLVEPRGIEPLTSAVRLQRSPI